MDACTGATDTINGKDRNTGGNSMTIRSALIAAGLAALAATAGPAQAVEIAVANYGSSVTGMPWAVALEKGFFKAAGADVTAIIGSQGGSSEVRNMIAGDLPYVD